MRAVRDGHRRCRATVDHRDVFFSAEEKRDNRRLCACVSRVSGGGIVLDSAWRPDESPSPGHATAA